MSSTSPVGSYVSAFWLRSTVMRCADGDRRSTSTSRTRTPAWAGALSRSKLRGARERPCAIAAFTAAASMERGCCCAPMTTASAAVIAIVAARPCQVLMRRRRRCNGYTVCSSDHRDYHRDYSDRPIRQETDDPPHDARGALDRRRHRAPDARRGHSTKGLGGGDPPYRARLRAVRRHGEEPG